MFFNLLLINSSLVVTINSQLATGLGDLYNKILLKSTEQLKMSYL